MSLEYEAPDPRNPRHKGKTFIFDISTLDVDALRATYKLARADEEQIGALRACIEEHLPALKKQCDMVMVKESGGVDESANVAALTLYNEYVGVLYQKLYSMRLEEMWDKKDIRRSVAGILTSSHANRSVTFRSWTDLEDPANTHSIHTWNSHPPTGSNSKVQYPRDSVTKFSTMPSIYDTPDEKNPEHQGKTFVYDAASKDVNELRQARQQSAANAQELITLEKQLATATSLALQRLKTMEKPFVEIEFNASLAYVHNILDVRSKVDKACRELIAIGYVCAYSACEQGVLI
ncbi:MAG: hypothetical protein LQ346_000969 [Caloplaca aetnensis]|nr:MAG: hypothetical protein LQ346_000969 [Caloplaca aetnensis]